VLQQSSLSVSVVLRANVPLRAGTTLYSRFGDTPTVALALLAVLSAWGLLVVEHRRKKPLGKA
jgi:apolipoprotein N-acyltransferase